MDTDVISILEKIWDDLECLFTGDGHPAYWGQGSYRSAFFQAFAETYAIEEIYGDQVKDHIRERHLNRSDPRYEEKLEVLEEICTAWNEWHYAWKHYPSE